jgi:hypothetical protein
VGFKSTVAQLYDPGVYNVNAQVIDFIGVS